MKYICYLILIITTVNLNMFQEIANNDEEECCSICLETINKNKNKVITNCGHTFHCICLIKNVSINGLACPYCRTNITEEENTDEDISIEDFSVEEDSTTEFNLANNAISIDNMNIVVLENEIYMNEARRLNQIEYEENIINEYVNQINIENYMERILSYHESRQTRLQPYTSIERYRQPQLELERQSSGITNIEQFRQPQTEWERQRRGLRPYISIEQYRQHQIERENRQILASRFAREQTEWENQRILASQLASQFAREQYASALDHNVLNHRAAAFFGARLEEPRQLIIEPPRQLVIEQGIQSALQTGNIRPRRNIRNNNRFQVLSYLRNI